MRWAFWRSGSSKPQRPLPDDVGLPTRSRPPAAPADRDDDGHPVGHPVDRTSGATPTGDPSATYEPPLSASARDVDRSALAAAGADVASLVLTGSLMGSRTGSLSGSLPDSGAVDHRTLAVAATGALAARLPALSGADGAGTLGEPADELLHAYADLLVARATARRTAVPVDREDLLAVAHVAAAAAAVGAAGDPALLLLAGVPADAQVSAAALLLAQTADDGGGAPDRLAGEVRELFAGGG